MNNVDWSAVRTSVQKTGPIDLALHGATFIGHSVPDYLWLCHSGTLLAGIADEVRLVTSNDEVLRNLDIYCQLQVCFNSEF